MKDPTITIPITLTLAQWTAIWSATLTNTQARQSPQALAGWLLEDYAATRRPSDQSEADQAQCLAAIRRHDRENPAGRPSVLTLHLPGRPQPIARDPHADSYPPPAGYIRTSARCCGRCLSTQVELTPIGHLHCLNCGDTWTPGEDHDAQLTPAPKP